MATFKITNYFMKESSIEAVVRNLDRRAFLKQEAAKILGIILVTIVSVFIPVFHFILVPTGAILFVVKLWRLRSWPLGHLEITKGNCLECGSPLPSMTTIVKWPIAIKCDGCHVEHYISV